MLYYTIERLNSMLLRFSVENFRSFKERQTLFLSAVKTCKEWRDENTAEDAGQRILRSAVIYGANARGKTNLFLAMERMRIFMLVSVDIDKNHWGAVEKGEICGYLRFYLNEYLFIENATREDFLKALESIPGQPHLRFYAK